MKSYKYRLYPSKKQRVKLEATLDICRHLYNDALGSRKLGSDPLNSWSYIYLLSNGM